MHSGNLVGFRLEVARLGRVPSCGLSCVWVMIVCIVLNTCSPGIFVSSTLSCGLGPTSVILLATCRDARLV